MLLAYRRGLLKPGYKNGFTSRLRENMLLISLSKELDAEDTYQDLIYTATVIAPHLDTKKVIGYIENKQYLLDYLKEYKLGSPVKYKNPKTNLLNTSKGLARAFQILKENGIIEKVKRRIADRERKEELEKASKVFKRRK